MTLRRHRSKSLAVSFLALAFTMPAFTQAFKDRAASFYEQGEFMKAAQALETHVKENPGDFSALLLIGLCYQQAGDPLGAAVAYQRAVDLRPKDSVARFRLAQAQYFAAKFSEAEKNTRLSLELGGSPVYIFNLLGLLLEQRHSYEDALAAYTKAIQADPREYAEPHLNSGILLLRSGRASEALTRLQAAIEIDPESKEAFYHRARAHLALSKPQDAEKDLVRAVAIDDYEPAKRLLDQLRSGGIQLAGETRKRAGSPTPIRFQNVASDAGLEFVLENHPTPEKHVIETMAGGVAAFDFNNDGLTDIFFANGATVPEREKSSPKYFNRLYRNDGEWKFTDVTAAAGVAGSGYSMGVAAGDYDNDGHVDLFIAGVKQNILYRNTGEEKFQDVTSRTGIKSDFWSVAAGWFDHDNDGWLDLFVVNYLQWSPSMNPYCGDPATKVRSYCDPLHYQGLPNTLYRNRGDGTFEDISRHSGIAAHVGKGMSLAFADYDGDGFTDVFVTNDALPDFLFHNRRDGTFEEVGLVAGVGLTDDGRPVSSMGVDFRDYDNDGLPDVVVTALARETFPLFRNQGAGFFRDVTYPSRLGFLSAPRSGWSNGFYDFNNDGWKDLFSANSHVLDNVEQFRPDAYRQANSIFANQGDGTFRDVSQESGKDFQQPAAHRGSAFAEFDNDGKIDIVTSSLGGPAELWRNVSLAENHWILLNLEGSKSNRDGIGASVRVGNRHNQMTSAVGYASSSHQGVHFGLRERKVIPEIEITWPGGVVQTVKDVNADQILTVREPE